MPLIIRQTERGEKSRCRSVERAKAIVEHYDRVVMKGHEVPSVIPFRRDGPTR
jgi:hypothetical protein